MRELKERVEKFIKDNKLEFDSYGSDLNSNCTILAGFICFVIEDTHTGSNIIDELPFSDEAIKELHRVFEFAWAAGYEDFWETEEAKAQYVF